MPARWKGVAGLIAAAALVVTFTNSLGAIAGRADVTQAERNTAKADEATDRAELRRIMRERAALNFTPAADDIVKAAREAVATAERIRLAECGSGDPKLRSVRQIANFLEHSLVETGPRPGGGGLRDIVARVLRLDDDNEDQPSGVEEGP